MSKTSSRVKLYPTSRSDRILLWLSITSGLMAILLISVARDFWGYFMAVVNVTSALFNLTLAYVFQDRPQGGEGREYSEMLEHLDETQKVMQVLSEFLERERLRVNETEQTLRRLQDEKSVLEPVVKTQRETVDAILSAHTSAARANAWKDRMLGFTLGVLSSLVASAILYIFGIGR